MAAFREKERGGGEREGERRREGGREGEEKESGIRRGKEEKGRKRIFLGWLRASLDPQYPRAIDERRNCVATDFVGGAKCEVSRKMRTSRIKRARARMHAKRERRLQDEMRPGWHYVPPWTRRMLILCLPI